MEVDECEYDRTRTNFFSGIFFLSSLCSASAQSVSLSIDEMFRLADQNSKSIRMHELAISEAEQGVKVAKDGRLPSIGFGLELQYIGDGWLSDRDFSNGVHADMPHFGNSYVIKASQVVYAGGGAVSRNIESSRLSQQMTEQEYANNRQNVRFLLLGHYLDLFQLNNQKVVYEKKYRADTPAGQRYAGLLSSGNRSQKRYYPL